MRGFPLSNRLARSWPIEGTVLSEYHTVIFVVESWYVVIEEVV